MQTERTILFLIADTGAGHRSAANAISNAIRIISQQEQCLSRLHTAQCVALSTAEPSEQAEQLLHEVEGETKLHLLPPEVVVLLAPVVRQ